MKKIFKKTFALLLCFVILVSAAPAIKCKAAEQIEYEKEKYYYFDGESDANYVSISIEGLKKTQKVKKVKSSNKKVGKISSVSKYYSSITDIKVDKDSLSGTIKSGSAYITVKIVDTGDTDITFKIGGKKYTSTIHVLDYVKPVKTVKITGVHKNKNIAPAFKYEGNCAYCYMKSVKCDSARINIKPVSGWKVESVTSYNESSGYYRSISRSQGVKSYVIGKLNAKKNYRIELEMVDQYNNTFFVYIMLQSQKK